MSFLLEPLDGVVNVVDLATDDVDGGAVFEEGAGNAVADSGGSSGDEGHLVLQDLLLEIHKIINNKLSEVGSSAAGVERQRILLLFFISLIVPSKF